MELKWNEIAAIRGMVLNGMTNTQILEVFEFETYEQCDEVLKVIEELKKELEKESDYGA